MLGKGRGLYSRRYEGKGRRATRPLCVNTEGELSYCLVIVIGGNWGCIEVKERGLCHLVEGNWVHIGGQKRRDVWGNSWEL